MIGQHTITALVQNEAGTLNRLVSLFRRRNFSLASLTAGDCEVEGFSRITMVVNGDDHTMRQCVSQLVKLIDVVEADDLNPRTGIRRELALIKVAAGAKQRAEVAELAGLFAGKIVDVTEGSVALEVSEDPAKLDRLLKLLEPYGITEVARSGVVALHADV